MTTRDQVVAGFLRDLVFFAASRGADVPALCQRAGVTSAMLAAPDELVDGRIAGALWHAAVAATGDADFGLQLGSASHLSSLGLLAPVLLHCRDLRRALGKFADYSRLLASAFALEVVDRADGASAVRFPLLPHDSYIRRAPRHPMECIVAATMVGAGQLVGRPLQLHEVQFRHAAPPSTRAHTTLFRAPVRFGMPIDQFVLAAEQLEQPILLADPAVLVQHEAKARELLAARGQADDVTSRVRQALGVLLRGELPTLEDVAAQLHTSARSLQRLLGAAGTSFRTLLDDVRRDLALAHLQDPNTAVAQIALLLGFSEASAFHRSFKRWTGTTPSRHRAKA